MSLWHKTVTRGLLYSALLLIAFSTAIPQVDAVECPAGKRLSTEADVAVKSGEIKAGVCYSDNEVGIGKNAEEARQYLRTLLRSSNKCIGSNQEIAGVNDAFAVCAARFLKEYTSRYGAPVITRAYNAVQCEATLCRNNPGCGGFNNNPAPQSNHTRGLAMDVSAGANQLKMAAFAKQNPQFGVCFPFVGSSFNDPWHMILAGIPGSEPRGPGCAGVTRACDGVSFDPNSVSNASGVFTSPSSSLSDQIRKSLGMQQQPPPPPPPAPASAPTQSATPSQTSTSQPIGSVAQTPPVSSVINTNTNTSNNTNTNSGATSTATSTFDLIQSYLDPVSDAIDIGTVVLIDLNADTSDATSLDGTRPTSTSHLQGTLALSQTLNVPQTFTSSDLANNPVSSYVGGDNTFALQLLEIMKNALLYALSVLTPFGGVPQTTYITE